jgi:hypothetical protein
VLSVDFEYASAPGERPAPLCAVARDVLSGELSRVWLEGGHVPARPPFDTGPDTLYVAYMAAAEVGCHLALGWPVPARILDLWSEFKWLTSGRDTIAGHSLLGALTHFGLPAMDAAEKKFMQQRAAQGGPFTAAERVALLDYCQEDVDAVCRLLPAMMPTLDLPRALLRGRYMAAVARMEWHGVPIDAEVLSRLRANWDAIRGRLIDAVDPYGEVYVPVRRAAAPAAVLEAAAADKVHPSRLTSAVDWLYQQDRAATDEAAAAIRAARRDTGLTVNRISRWENAGRDCSTWPGLDATARELAGQYPALGIGPGYIAGESADLDPDYAGLLWERLREPDPTAGPRYSAERLQRAAGLLADDPDAARPLGRRSFSATRFGLRMARLGIAWPRLESGAYSLEDQTFGDMAKAYPEEVGPWRELRSALDNLKCNGLTVGADGRNRYSLWAFSSVTGRNQPSNSKCIFGPSVWLRHLIRPPAGRAIAYCDWSQQELAIAAALSGDAVMQEAYQSGDFYMTFAKMSGAVPPDATKESHGHVREQYKVVALAVLFWQGAEGIAQRLSIPLCYAREILGRHRRTFPRFWEWSEGMVDAALQLRRMTTRFGWSAHFGSDVRLQAIANWPMQSNGSDMMRIAACLATERGLMVCAPVHDAFLIEASADAIDEDTARMQGAMREASEAVLPGFPLRTEAKVVRHPERYSDPRGRGFWRVVQGLLEEVDPVPAGPFDPVHFG